MSGPGYVADRCHFNFPGCEKDHAAYQRAEDKKPTGPFFDACENCARKPYPTPPQFQKEEGQS